MVKYTPADKKAIGLAKKIMGKAFNKLMEKRYLTYTIKIKSGSKIIDKKIVIGRDVRVFIYNTKSKKYNSYCSELVGEVSYHWSDDERRRYERGEITDWRPTKRFSIYDRLIGFHLWFKHYKKNPLSYSGFRKRFNLLGLHGMTLDQIKNGE